MREEKTLNIQGMESPIHRNAPRFYVAESLSAGTEVCLPERASNHIAVLRLREGDPITLFNGDGAEYPAILLRPSRRSAMARVSACLPVNRESGLDITLAQSLSGSDRMDVTLQKATELGVCAIQPLESERSVVRLSGDRVEKRMTHWRNVITAACEQCGRNLPPALHRIERLQDWLVMRPAAAPREARLLLSPEADTGLNGMNRSEVITLLVGPEGGLAPHEHAAALAAGFVPVRLGPRVLRTETAPLAAVAALQTLWGDMG